MRRVGINGHLADAICKTRLLVGLPERSVRVVTTEHCRPLLQWLSALPPVAEVVVDEAARSTNQWGEHTEWSVPVDVDTSFLAFPDEWVVNFIGKAHGLPVLPFGDWFGVWREALGPVVRTERLFVGRVKKARELLARMREFFPDLEMAQWDETADISENARVAAGCSVRVVAPGEEAQMMSVCGLECVVDRGTHWDGGYGALFCPPGARLAESRSLSVHVLEMLERCQPGAEKGFQRVSRFPRVAVGIPTICCGDLLAESVAALAPQLGELDEIVVLDNGSQGLVEKLSAPRVRVMESEQNLGVAGSWNRLLRETVCNGGRWDWLVLMNDDVAFGPDQWRLVKEVLRSATEEGKWMVTGAFQWSVIALNRACVENVGWFDEGFFPAYFEDNDYHRRLLAVDGTRAIGMVNELAPAVKRSSQTVARRPELNRFGKNRQYYVEKWGGPPGQEQFAVPYNRVNRPVERPAGARVIVCVPTYHRTQRLVQAVESLRAQTFSDFEVWVVKDGCAQSSAIYPPHCERTCIECDECNRTTEWMRRICDGDPRFRYFSLPVNAGDGWAARNFIIQNTTHELITYLDDDNWLEPEHLALLVARLDETGAQMAYTGTKIWRNGNPAEDRVHVAKPVFGQIDTSEILHRRELIDRYGGWQDRYRYGCNDWGLVKRWMDADATWAHTGRVTHNYRMPSVHQTPVPEKPWMSDVEISAIEKVLTQESVVLEYGSGGSTRWLAKRVKTVHSVEHDAGWAARVARSLPKNSKLHQRNPEFSHSGCEPAKPGQFATYVKTPDSLGVMFDACLVDGRARIECAVAAAKWLKPGGWLFIHDWFPRERYTSRIEELLPFYELREELCVRDAQSLAVFARRER